MTLLGVPHALRFLRARALAFCALLLSVAAAGACTRGDVGAPCNHASLQAPVSDVVTYPAITCNDLLCVFLQDNEAPEGDCNAMGGNTYCNVANPAAEAFECNADGACQPSLKYALARSMCSKKCADDDDCRNKAFKKNVANDHACQLGFKCARVQSLGEFCCQKICACQDDFDTTLANELETACPSGQGAATACCSEDPNRDGCGS